MAQMCVACIVQGLVRERAEEQIVPQCAHVSFIGTSGARHRGEDVRYGLAQIIDGTDS